MINSNVVRFEKPIHGTTIAVSVHSNWRRLPPVLHTIKSMDCSIHKAKYWNEWTSMYIKSPHPISNQDLGNLIQTSLTSPDGEMFSCGLPFNTSIHIYNISTCPYTVLDFGCIDRTGLFCEIIEALSKYDIEVQGAYINTIGTVVSNIFYITHNDELLSDAYIEYLRNNLEAEVKLQHDSY